MKLTYKQSGVDIKKADEFVAGIKGFVSTNMATNARAFGSPFNLAPFLSGCKEPVLVSSTDGVGTKLKIAIECNIHNTVGIDLVGMSVNDVICLGAKPLFFLDYIACGRVKPKVLKDIVSGIHRGMKQSDCCLVGGETAEMPGMYKEDEYDLAGFCAGLVDRKKMIDGRSIKPGDIVIGLSSSGLHSNGFSLARKALGAKGVKKYARELLVPTRIYVKPVLSLLASHSASIKGIAHITGGAFYSKATKIMPGGSGMVLYKNNWPVPRIFQVIRQAGRIPEREMYTVFNMGIGMLLVVDKGQACRILDFLGAYKEFNSYVAGEIVKSKNKMSLV